MTDRAPSGDGSRARAARIAAAVLALALAALVVARCRRGEPERPAAPVSSSASPARTEAPLRALPPSRVAAPPLPASAPPAPSFDPSMSRKERAKFTLASYLDWAQYPPTSRPARERPDRQRPHAAATRTLPLSRGDKGAPQDKAGSKISVVLSQSHYYLAGEETATFTLSCRRGDAPAPCAVTGATAEAAAGATGKAQGPATLTFSDDGGRGDAAANDGAWTAAFTPASAGFADVIGPIAILAQVDAEGERGAADFQISYTGKAPAAFTGAVRESLEGGSLRLCVELQVTDAGRYVLDGRVDDAGGETFAFVSFNEVLAAGKQEACFTVFGKLVLDEEAKSPFKLRDVEGFLLLEDTFPDRRTLRTLEGVVHTTKAYESRDFSKAEWQSPVKDRYVERLKKDAEGDEE